uniref:Putative secreted protein n=1 Tax=Anopheles triannulatus TaxID=58253 RepID=A0A2M4B152_9DIPT
MAMRTTVASTSTSAFSPAFADQVPYVRTLRAVIAATALKDSTVTHARLRVVSITTNVHGHRADEMLYAGTRSVASGANAKTVFPAIR